MGDLEGVEAVDDVAIPTIVTAHDLEDLKEKWGPMAFVLSGRLSGEMKEHEDKPAFDATKDIKKLVDLIESQVCDRLPNFPDECCMACGMTCKELAAAIIAGTKRRADCVADQNIELYCNSRRIKMVPFVQRLLKNALLGVVSELDGYEKGCQIEVRLTDNLFQIQEK